MARVILLDADIGKSVTFHQFRDGVALIPAYLEKDRAARFENIQRIGEITVIKIKSAHTAVERETRLEIPDPRIERLSDRALDVRRI